MVQRFCKEVVLMKQLGHDNILPFYGVSTTDYDFCMVFPWYENGNIMDYLKKKPDADKFDLASAFRQSHTHDAYSHPRTVIRRGPRVALSA